MLSLCYFLVALRIVVAIFAGAEIRIRLFLFTTQTKRVEVLFHFKTFSVVVRAAAKIFQTFQSMEEIRWIFSDLDYFK